MNRKQIQKVDKIQREAYEAGMKMTNNMLEKHLTTLEKLAKRIKQKEKEWGLSTTGEKHEE